MQDMRTLTCGLAVAGAAGGVLGLLFFGGLWWTLRRALNSANPALWIGGSLLLRVAAAVTGFVLVSAGDWRRMLACLLGFWIARWLVVRLTRRPATEPSVASILLHELAHRRPHRSAAPAQGRVHGSP